MLCSDMVKQKIKELSNMYELVGVESTSKRVACPYVDCPGYPNRCEVALSESSWYCHICKRGGDVFTWIQQSHNISFIEAKRLLARRYGVSYGFSSERCNMLEQVLVAAHKYLIHSNKVEYLNNRHISNKIIWKYKLGYIDSDDVVLENSGLSLSQLESLGLLYKSITGGYTSALAGRYIFPIREVSGNLIQLKGRADPVVHGPDVKKSIPLMKKPPTSPDTWGSNSHMDYLFLEDTLGYSKTKEYVVVTEGEPDALTLQTLDIRSVGLQTSQGIYKHAHKLRGIKTVYVALDNDQASQMRILDELYELQIRLPDTDVRLITIPFLKGDNIKVDVNDLAVEFKFTRPQFMDLLHDSKSAHDILVSTWGLDYKNRASFEKLAKLIRLSTKKDLLIKQLARVTNKREEVIRFAVDPSSLD